jgi:hypothetical protein
MKTAFIAISSIITILAVLPYIIDVVKGNTKPRVVSWFTWVLLTAITAAASFSDKQYASAILSLTASIECLIVVILGLKYGDRKFTLFDISCQIGALVGIALWLIFNSPGLAIIAAILIDVIGGLPTLKHAWEKPYEETWITFMLSGLGAMFTVFAVNEVSITALANPLYLVIINFVFTAVLLSRHKIKRVL